MNNKPIISSNGKQPVVFTVRLQTEGGDAARGHQQSGGGHQLSDTRQYQQGHWQKKGVGQLKIVEGQMTSQTGVESEAAVRQVAT